MNLKTNCVENISIPRLAARFARFAGISSGILIWLALLVFAILITAEKSYSETPDYQSLREDPVETAYRKLISHGEVEWDETEMAADKAPAFIKDMKWPLKTGELAGGFYRTGGKGHRKHTGIDIVAPKGTPVYAAMGGVVEVVSNGGNGFRGYGKVIIINHANQLWTLYSHCSTMNVKVGQPVEQGQIIAAVGSTGRATTNHLHFEIRSSKGTPLDPLRYIKKYEQPSASLAGK